MSALGPASRALGPLLALVALAGACGRDPLPAARDRALAFFATEVREPDPGWASLFGYLHRRFGLEVRLASGELAHERPRASRRPELAALYERLRDPAAGVPVQAIAGLPDATDRMTASALHCDRIPLAPNWVEVLRAAARAGGYALTHSALAAEWTIENGCRSWVELAPLQREQAELLARLVDERAALTAGHSAPTDLWIEALAMLYYSGAGDRVRPEWVRALLEAQRPDGGWPRHPRDPRSDPHPTALALWVLLENLEPRAPPISWVPSS